MSDIFREVEEELRRDRLYSLWKRYGLHVIAGLVLVVAIAAGIRAYQAWDRAEAGDSGTRYSRALELLQEDDTEAGRAILAELAADGYAAYPVLARMREAAVLGRQGEADAAVEIYDRVAADEDADDMLRDLARLRATILLVDQADPGIVRSRLESLAESDSPWRHSARELIALSLYRAGDHAAADAEYDRIMSDPAVPVGLRGRAEMMRSLIAPNLTSGTP